MVEVGEGFKAVGEGEGRSGKKRVQMPPDRNGMQRARMSNTRYMC